jgi:hypothetical protein
MNLLAYVSIGCALAAVLGGNAACGSDVHTNQAATGSSGAGGAGSTGTGITTGTGTGPGVTTGTGAGGSLPDECQVETSEPAPYTTTFRFTNPGDLPVFLRQSCYLEYRVSSCGDGYASSLALHADCTVDCAMPGNGCIACGACFEDGVAVPAHGSYDDTWSGLRYTFGTTADGCSCHTGHAAAAGLYRISAEVYATQEDAQMSAPAFETSTDFALATDGGVIEVALVPPG